MTRERVLEAAMRVFLERGYADATIDDIVTAAALGRATFYLHFKSKLEVMRAIIQVKEQENERLIEELRVERNPTRESLEAWLRRFVEYWAAESDRFLVGLQALASEPGLSDEIETGIQLARDTLAVLLEKKRKLPPAEASLRAALLVGALQHGCRALATRPDSYDVELVTNVLTDLWAHDLIA